MFNFNPNNWIKFCDCLQVIDLLTQSCFFQIPPDEGSTAAPVEVLSSPPVLDSSSVSLPADVITPPVPEQVTEGGKIHTSPEEIANLLIT